MDNYKKLKNTWISIERYGNITGNFGLVPSQAEIYYGYDIGYDYPPVINSPVEYSCKKNKYGEEGVT